jgi:uncharacterized protein (DUF2336 family)
MGDAMLKRLIGKIAEREALPGKMTYAEARASLETHAHNARVFLAKRPDVEPEILYYLASDDAAEVRRLVAANPGTPQQANKLLAQDRDDEVRCELARKIGQQLSDPAVAWSPRARALAFEAAEVLAHDKLARVRAMLAEEIKSASSVPSHLIEELARDEELIVRAPVLMYSPLLQAS